MDAIYACCLSIASRCEAYRRLVIRTLPQLDKIDSQDVTRDERAAAAADTSTEMLAFLKAVGVDTAATASNTSVKPTAAPASSGAAAESSIKKLDSATGEKQSAQSQSTVQVEGATARRLSDSVNVAALRRAMSIGDVASNADATKPSTAAGAATAGTCIREHCEIS
jgi:hypothetical protein